MEDYQFLNAAFMYGQRNLDEERFMTAARKWAESLYGEKTIVSDSLPVWAELLTEIRFKLLVDIDQDGEPRSSMAELLEMWDKVNKALKTIGK
jgi:hypothetical protein